MKASRSTQQDLPLQFAGARADITPLVPVPLAGVEGRTNVWERVASRLEANAFVLGDRSVRTLWVSADLLYFGPALVDALHLRAAAAGVAPGQVILAASHTHFAPATDCSKPRLGAVDAGYEAFLLARLCELVDAVLLAPTVAVRGELTRVEAAGINVNRRRRWPLPTLTRDGFKLPPSLVMAPAPNAARDAHVDLLRFIDAEGSTRGVAWKFACHPVCFPEPASVCAEFPGRARDRLRGEMASDLPVVFLQGFTGDVRPWLTGRRALSDQLQVLRRGPGFGEVDLPTWEAWADRLADCVCRAATQAAGTPLPGPLRMDFIDLPMADVIDAAANPAAADRSLRIQRLDFGAGLSVLFVAAEVCSPYLARFGAGAKTLCVGYTGHVFGYLPSQAQAMEGGYEGGSYFARFGLHGTLRAGFEEAVVAAVARLQGQALSVR